MTIIIFPYSIFQVELPFKQLLWIDVVDGAVDGQNKTGNKQENDLRIG